VFTPRRWLHRVFEVGIIGKGINGVVELIGSLLLLFLQPTGIHRLAAALTQSELSEDSDNYLANLALHTANSLTGSTLMFGAIYLLAHGLVKVVLVAALLNKKFWAYPWMIGVLTLFIGYQTYRIVVAPTVPLLGLTIFDLAILALTWREYRQQRSLRQLEPPAGQPGALAALPCARHTPLCLRSGHAKEQVLGGPLGVREGHNSSEPVMLPGGVRGSSSMQVRPGHSRARSFGDAVIAIPAQSVQSSYSQSLRLKATYKTADSSTMRTDEARNPHSRVKPG
jgi:uncharacterized membrane protein